MTKEVHTLDFCEECVLGKAHKLPFPTARHTTTEILGYVHSDLWGSVSMPRVYQVASIFSR